MSHAQILARFGELDAALREARGRPEAREHAQAWCVQEIGEHVALTNLYLLRLAHTCAAKCRARAAQARTAPRPATVAAADLERSSTAEFRWDAPAHMRPAGAVPLAESIATLEAQRDETLRLWDELCAGAEPAGRLHDVAMSVLGPEARIALPELLLFLALHAQRHAHQVRRALRAG